jgi:hypothetical protein
VTPLQDALDQLLEAYFEGTLTRAEVYEQILALVPTHGADAVFAALPPPWKRTFYEWAREMFANDIAVDRFVSIGSPAPPEAIEAIRGWLARHDAPPSEPEFASEIEDYFKRLPDDIDYKSLDTATLFQLAIQQREPFTADHALAELARRNVHQARDAAEAILMQPVWDHYHTAYAIRVLYGRDRGRACELMTTLLGTDDPVILDAMVDIVLENPEYFTKPDRYEFARALATRVAATPPGDHTDSERRARFLTQYGAKES